MKRKMLSFLENRAAESDGPQRTGRRAGGPRPQRAPREERARAADIGWCRTRCAPRVQRAGARGQRGLDRGHGRAGQEEKEMRQELQRRRIVAMSGRGCVAERNRGGEPQLGEGQDRAALVPRRLWTGAAGVLSTGRTESTRRKLRGAPVPF